jgi:hypothetical protein
MNVDAGPDDHKARSSRWPGIAAAVAMMESNAKGGLRIETPYLRIPYRSYEFAQRGIPEANS